MNEQEIKALWVGQTYDEFSEVEIWRQLMKQRHKQKWVKAGLMVLTPLAFGAWLWTISVVLFGPDSIWSNSLFKVVMVSTVFICTLSLVRQHIRDRRRMDALKNDTRSFIDYLILTTRKELRELRSLPWFIGVIFLLILLAEWQSILSVGELPNGAVLYLGSIAATLIIGSVYSYLRIKNYLKPHLESLEKTRAAFDHSEKRIH